MTYIPKMTHSVFLFILMVWGSTHGNLWSISTSTSVSLQFPLLVQVNVFSFVIVRGLRLSMPEIETSILPFLLLFQVWEPISWKTLQLMQQCNGYKCIYSMMSHLIKEMPLEGVGSYLACISASKPKFPRFVFMVLE